MSIEVIAILKNSGRAIVKEDGNYFHLQPPYDLDCKKSVSANELDFALGEYGFESCHLVYENYSDLSAYLVSVYQENQKESYNENERMLEVMPVQFVKMFHEKLIQKFSMGEYRIVVTLGNRILDNVNINDYSEKGLLETLVDNSKQKLIQTDESKCAVFENIEGELVEQRKSVQVVDSVSLRIAPFDFSETSNHKLVNNKILHKQRRKNTSISEMFYAFNPDSRIGSLVQRSSIKSGNRKGYSLASIRKARPKVTVNHLKVNK